MSESFALLQAQDLQTRHRPNSIHSPWRIMGTQRVLLAWRQSLEGQNRGSQLKDKNQVIRPAASYTHAATARSVEVPGICVFHHENRVSLIT